MIYSVQGIVTHIEPNLAVVECGGVGFACRTTANTLSAIQAGDTVKLYTYMHVREDAMLLFGFGDKAELHAFQLLLSVSGVGPKAALSILSDLSPQGFALCVAGGDAKALTRTQGIGAKTAQRIVLELKDKIDKQMGVSSAMFGGGSTGAPVGAAAEAVSALMALGFSVGQATAALDGLPSDLPTPERIKQALKRINTK